MSPIDRSSSALSPRRARLLLAAPIVAALAASALLVAACGGGSEIVAVIGFIGTGGGQYFKTASASGFTPADCGGEVCVMTLSVDAPVDPNTGVPPPVFFSSQYKVKASGSLPDCNGASGSVDGAVVNIGACFSGKYVSVNELHSDDGKTVLFYDYFPDLTAGVWVDIRDGNRRYKFTSNNAGCEITSSGKKPLTAAVQASNYGTVAFDPGTALIPATTVQSIAVSGGPTWSGSFVGASGMHLTSAGGDSVDLERRDLGDGC